MGSDEAQNIAQVVTPLPPDADLTAIVTPGQYTALAEAIQPAINELTRTIREIADRAAEAWQNITNAVSIYWYNFVDSMLYLANDNPKWWHLYKHAKKARTRKKYRSKLMRQLLRELEEAKEVRA